MHDYKSQKIKSQPVTDTAVQKQGSGKPAFQLADKRPETITQRKVQEMANSSPQSAQAAQLQAMADQYATSQHPLQKKENKTGLPGNLRSGIEQLSGIDMSDVQVHYNSVEPAQLQAHAYAQGTDIHIATGQEKHLAHEAWHVVQQKQGRVKPTMQMKGKVNVNDDAGLEKEADVMGRKALTNPVPGVPDVTQQKSREHAKGCTCSSCSTVSRKSIEVGHTHSSSVRTAKVTVENHNQAGKSADVIQRIQCDVSQNGRIVGSSPQIGKGGKGGVSHAEQQAWRAAGPPAISAGDIIKFQVDGPICSGCTDWFENYLYPIVHGAGATLMVNILYDEPGGSQYYGTIEVTGPGTVWGKVSEAGYYGHGGLDGDREVVRALGQALR